jgi:HK97 family phage prohead protease
MSNDVYYKQFDLDGETKSTIRFIASTESEDGDGDVVRAEGWDLRRYKRNPIVLYGHNHMLPIGVSQKISVENKSLVADIKLADEGTSEFIDTVRKLIDQKILRAVSVGFRATAAPVIRRDKDGGFQGFEFNGTELLENSIVAVPSNPEALSAAKSFGASDRVLNRLVSQDASVQIATRARLLKIYSLGVSGKIIRK